MSTDTTALQEKALRALRGRETPQTEAKEEERTMSSNDLTKRIARALYENAEYYGPEDAQPSWDLRDNEERGEWMEIAAAVLPVIAAEAQAAKAEALREMQEHHEREADKAQTPTIRAVHLTIADGARKRADDYETGART